ncbi:hypothetical protein [Methylomonas albis]|uniref:DUF2252 domain-containing protein n=1 Tax=Methylomonas albis TaxID=1854563 RepID=A0ABR9CZL2_9GAMM|nr:DUF2252 family protein [Methylomonas albis]MBD9356282.1 DUF2252 domain-containing protein [Methylomonas albis]CAD6879356.1 hypothetical protein [Methylomonas albis]
MTSTTLRQRIDTFNQGRDPERLHMKYQAMRESSFAFLRGTAHLFYQDWPQQSALNDAPLAWVCGDLHLENFGSYRGDNRLSYFDINDFDEALLAPCTWDIARFLCSLLVAAQSLEIKESQALALCKSFLLCYSQELQVCKARWIERSTASGMIRDLLKNLKHRSRADLLDERTFKRGSQRVLKIDGHKTLVAAPADQQKVKSIIEQFAATQPNSKFFDVLDVARRIAGLGSLGLECYVVLIQGKGRRQHYLLDLKYQPGSALATYSSVPQPAWKNEAERVVRLQRRGQAIAPAFLSAVQDGQRAYLLKELMPTQDRLKLDHWHGKFKRLEKVVVSMAHLTAWLHIRNSGWQGSAIADQWQAFGQRTDWQDTVLEYAQGYSGQVQSDWLRFKTDSIYFPE